MLCRAIILPLDIADVGFEFDDSVVDDYDTHICAHHGAQGHGINDIDFALEEL